MMRQMQSSVLPDTGRDRQRRDRQRRDRPRAQIVERIAGWSARHRKTAVLGWLLLVAAVFVAGQQIGTKNLPSYDPGASGRAERVLQRVGFTTPPAESVLIQARRPGARYLASPELRHAVAEVVTALRALPASAADIGSPAGTAGTGGPGHGGPGSSGGGRRRAGRVPADPPAGRPPLST